MLINYSVSLLGEPCPYPAIVAKEIMSTIKSNEVVEILSDCPQSINGITSLMQTLGHECEVFQNGPILAFYIKKS